jgi:hypothetical protein
MKQTTNFNEYNIVGDDSSLTINNSSGSLVSFTNGNLGIGTISPTEKFEVNEGFIRSTGSSIYHGFELARDNFSTYQIKHLDGGLTIFNLNATRKEMTFKGNGRIGINNSNPIEILDIIGNIKADGILKLFDLTDTQTIELNPDGDSYINGNLGIGTTTPSKALDIVANNGQQFRLAHTTADNALKNAYINVRHYNNSEEDFTMMLGGSDVSSNTLNIGGGTTIGNTATVLRFYTAENTTTTVGTVRMLINSTGNVGIGTTTPTRRLHISKTDGNNELVTLRIENNLGYSEFGTLSNYARILSNGDELYAGSLAATFFYIGNETIQTFKYFNSQGYVGIRNQNPTETLDVNGNIKADGILKLYDITNTQTIELNPDGDSYINGGNVGIGTDNPAVDLHVADDVRIDSDLFVRTISSQYFSSSNDLNLIYGDAANFNIYSNTTERFRITSDGNVGIGTTSPTERLDVNGNIKSSGYITGKRCGAAGYLASPVNVTVTTANTYYPIGVFTVPVAEDFVVGTTYPNGLKYSGTLAQTFHITWNATIESTSNNVTATIDIQKNGVSIAMSKMGTYAKTGGEIYNLSGQCVVDLDTNDEVRFVVTADTNGEVLTFDYFAASIKEFFD